MLCKDDVKISNAFARRRVRSVWVRMEKNGNVNILIIN